MSVSVARQITLRQAASGDIRKETFEGKEHLVIPVVALVEGVIQAMNAPKPELVLAERFAVAPSGWNGRPVFLNHPMSDGRPISGNSPEVLTSSFGRIFNTRVASKRLLMEAWLDPTKTPTELLDRVNAKDPIEISTGAFIVLEDKKGTHAGVPYQGIWDIIIPDHLALLQEQATGACSRKMGCGVRAAVAYDVDGEKLHALYADEDFRTLRNIPQSERDKMPASDFAGPNRSFPIAEPEDVGAASSSLGRAKGNQTAIKKKIIAIAYRKGADFVAKLPDTWKRGAKQKNAEQAQAQGEGQMTVLQRLREFIGLAVSQEGMSDNDVRNELREALRETDPAFGWIEAVYDDRVIYGTYDAGSQSLYARAYTMDSNGEATVADTRVEVEPVLTYEPVEADEEPTAAKGARNSKKDQQKIQSMHDHSVDLGANCAGMKASSAGCGCGNSAVSNATAAPAAW